MLMRTHVELDDRLIEQVLQLGQFPTKKAAIHAALEDYVKVLKRRELLTLRGKVRWEGDLDALRTSRSAAPR